MTTKFFFPNKIFLKKINYSRSFTIKQRETTCILVNFTSVYLGSDQPTTGSEATAPEFCGKAQLWLYIHLFVSASISMSVKNYAYKEGNGREVSIDPTTAMAVTAILPFDIILPQNCNKLNLKAYMIDIRRYNC